METVLERIKKVLETDGTLSTKVKKFERVAPRALPALRTTDVPWIGIAPISSPEIWKAQRKEATHTVEIYAVVWLMIQEKALIGDSTHTGLLDLQRWISSAIRGNTLSNYLSKPLDIIGVDYSVAGYGDNIYLMVGTTILQCVRLFEV